MKRPVISAAIFFSVFMSVGVFAADYDAGVLTINGKVVGTTCQFIGTNTAEISLNEIGADKLSTLNIGEVYNNVVNSTQVPLKIKCEEGKVPRISFSSTQFDGNDITYNNGTATGVGFAVYYGDSTDKVNPQSGVVLKGGKDGVYDLSFSARYARLAGGVSAGDVNSTLTLTVVTD